MKPFPALWMLFLTAHASSACAQACWNEWAYKEQWLIRAHQCSENISIKDFEKGFCQTRIESDQLRKAQTCPSSGKTKEGLDVVPAPVVARCVGMRPPGAEGEVTRVFYGHANFSRDQEGLKKICTLAHGRWTDIN